MDRKTLLNLADAALTVRASAFARDASRSWLGQWPGDFRVRYFLAQAYQQLRDLGAAARHIEIAQVADPEEVAFYQTASDIQSALGQEEAARDSLGFVSALSTQPIFSPLPLPSWAELLRQGLAQAQAHNYAEAQRILEEVERARPDSLLPAWAQLKTAWLAGDYEAVLSLGAASRQRWPGCPAILLALAQASLATGKSTQAVELLHLAAVADPAREVGARMLGAFNPYLALWPAQLKADIRLSIPTAVAFAAGMNKLSGTTPAARAADGSTDTPTLDPSPVAGAQAVGPPTSLLADEAGAEIRPLPGERFAGPSGGPPSPPAPAPAEASVPVSTPDETPVEIRPLPGEHFQGPSGALPPNPGAPQAAHGTPPSGPTQPADAQAQPQEDEDLIRVRAELDRVARRLHMRKKVADQERRRPSLVVLSSLANLQSQYGPSATAAIGQSLASLVRSQHGRKGWSAYAIYVDDAETLNPFQLESVTASNAADVKRLVTQLDSALARRGEMIGALLIIGGHDIIPFHRLPNPADDDDHDVPSDSPYATRDENYYVPEWPVSRIPNPTGNDPQFLLKAIQRIIEAAPAKAPSPLARLFGWIRLLFHPRVKRFRKSLGYTASIWHSASLGVYQPIGQPNSMLISPPTDADTLPASDLVFPRYTYFNLHGLEDGPEWFGQRSPGAASSALEFPTALRPSQVTNSGRAPTVVFSEACYGANVLSKTIDSALALKFLQSGTRALVGSTKIAYGAAAPPLIGADLVALHYWQGLTRGLPSGEALRQAKLTFAEEMRRRQGYLDGEDQKTLISFIHLGDPLFVPREFAQGPATKSTLRRESRPADLDLLAVKALDDTSLASLPADLENSLKEVLKASLPGMTDSRARVFETQIVPRRDSALPKDPAATSSAGGLPAWVISLDKRFEGHGSGHAQYARLSLDAAGHLIKLAVSR